jgi:putative SOS response-associated peptidase YedK
MCVNFQPSPREHIERVFNTDVPGDYPSETWKGYVAPIVLRHENQQRVELSSFGLIPPWCKSALDAKKLTSGTMNARTETVAEKPSFKNAWRKSHFCLVPMREFFEPCYESGKAVRYGIRMSDGKDFAAAGIWSWWRDSDTGEGRSTFALLTLNADDHPVLKNFHKPGDEKRSLFIVPPNEYDLWLGATADEARAMLTLLPPEQFDVGPRVVSRAPKTADKPFELTGS